MNEERIKYVEQFRDTNLFLRYVEGPQEEKIFRYSNEALDKFKSFIIWHYRALECSPTIGEIYEGLENEMAPDELYNIVKDYKEGKI